MYMLGIVYILQCVVDSYTIFYTYIPSHTHSLTYTPTYTYTYIHYIHILTHTHTHTYTHIDIYWVFFISYSVLLIATIFYTYIPSHTHILTYTPTYIHYIHILTHTHTRTHTGIYWILFISYSVLLIATIFYGYSLFKLLPGMHVCMCMYVCV